MIGIQLITICSFYVLLLSSLLVYLLVKGFRKNTRTIFTKFGGKVHRRQPRRGCRGRIPTNILVGGDISGNVPTNIRGGNVVEYELLIASVKRKQR